MSDEKLGVGYAVWTSPDGMTAVELDGEGCWIRTRPYPGAMWEAPEQLIRNGGNAKVKLELA